MSDIQFAVREVQDRACRKGGIVNEL
jgi:hypothetical protein